MSGELRWEIENVAYEHPTYGDILVTASGILTKYYPAVMYLPNGDPGYPEEGGDAVVKTCEARYEETDEKVPDFKEDDIPQVWWQEQADESAWDPDDPEN